MLCPKSFAQWTITYLTSSSSTSQSRRRLCILNKYFPFSWIKFSSNLDISMAQPFWVNYLLVNLNPLSSRVGCHDNIKDKCFWCSWWVIAFKYGKVAQNWTNLPTTVPISPITAPQKEFQFPPQDHVPILTSKQTTRDLTGKEKETFNYLSVVIFLQICSWLEKTLLINFSIIYYLLWQNHLFDLHKKQLKKWAHWSLINEALLLKMNE